MFIYNIMWNGMYYVYGFLKPFIIIKVCVYVCVCVCVLLLL